MTTSRLPDKWVNTRNQVAICSSFASVWQGSCSNFSRPIASARRRNPMQSQITLNNQLKISLISKWYQFQFPTQSYFFRIFHDTLFPRFINVTYDKKTFAKFLWMSLLLKLWSLESKVAQGLAHTSSSLAVKWHCPRIGLVKFKTLFLEKDMFTNKDDLGAVYLHQSFHLSFRSNFESLTLIRMFGNVRIKEQSRAITSVHSCITLTKQIP